MDASSDDLMGGSSLDSCVRMSGSSFMLYRFDIEQPDRLVLAVDVERIELQVDVVAVVRMLWLSMDVPKLVLLVL